MSNSSNWSSNSCNSSSIANNSHGNEFLGEIIINNTNNNKYLIINKIGYGTFSSVWLGYSLVLKELVAIKIYHPQEFNNSINEINILNKIKNSNINTDYIITCIDIFEIQPLINLDNYFNSDEILNNHKIIVLPFIGYSTYDLLDFYEDGINNTILLKIIKQLLLGLIEFEKLNLFHTDLKPENILLNGKSYKIRYIEDYINTLNLDNNLDETTLKNNLKLIINEYEDYINNNENANLLLPEYLENINIKLCDFNLSIENNDYNIQNNEIQTRYYRSPEIIMGYNISKTTDYWSIPCIIYELLTGEILFNPEKTDECSTDIIHLNLIIEFFDHIPLELIKNAPYYDKLFKDDKLINIDSTFICSLTDYLKEYDYLEKNNEYNKIVNIMNDMFIINPKERKNLYEILNKYY